MHFEAISQGIQGLEKLKKIHLRTGSRFTDVNDLGLEKLQIDWKQVLSFLSNGMPEILENKFPSIDPVSQIIDYFSFQEINEIISKPFHKERAISLELLSNARIFLPYIFMKGKLNSDDPNDDYYKILIKKPKSSAGIEIIDKETFLTAKRMFLELLISIFGMELYIETKPEYIVDFYQIKNISRENFLNLKKILSYFQLQEIRYGSEFIFSPDKSRNELDLGRSYISRILRSKDRDELLNLKESNENEIFLSGIEDHYLLKILQVEEKKQKYLEH